MYWYYLASAVQGNRPSATRKTRPVLAVPQESAALKRVKAHHGFFEAASVVFIFSPGRKAQVVDVRVGEVVDCRGRSGATVVGGVAHYGSIPDQLAARPGRGGLLVRVICRRPVALT